ncbi:MAG: hypothetical protein JJT94_14385, partial [Bernardetiaceae bacterium]|nr:hypothetical protein [Bernardetiaceae bacterium]
SWGLGLCLVENFRNNISGRNVISKIKHQTATPAVFAVLSKYKSVFNDWQGLPPLPAESPPRKWSKTLPMVLISEIVYNEAGASLLQGVKILDFK